MKAIQTKYLPAGNVRGSRIKAWAEGCASVSIDYPHELSGVECHLEAARKLCRKMGWKGTLVSGGLPDQSGYVFCFADGMVFDIDATEVPQ